MHVQYACFCAYHFHSFVLFCVASLRLIGYLRFACVNFHLKMISRRLFFAVLCVLKVSSAFVPHSRRNAFSTRLHMTEPEKRRRMTEFLNLEPLEDNELRRERKERDSRTQSQFASYGDELWDHRAAIERLTEELMDAMDSGEEKEEWIRNELSRLEKRDPGIVYAVEMEAMDEAQKEGRMEDAEKHKEIAMAARSCLPQFNLEGLWVGKYGGHGYEMINVTYAGDILVAYKVTGDKNVPRGEITFQADLSLADPLLPQQSLAPIILTEKAAKKWGTKQLPRYNGLGQVAEEGFVNNQWMEGQLILIGQEYFSFAWVPIEHQIFFGRPSPELALKMLRNAGSVTLKDKTWSDAPPNLDEDLEVLKTYAAHCLQVTQETIDEDLRGDAFGCIWHGVDTEECYFE